MKRLLHCPFCKNEGVGIAMAAPGPFAMFVTCDDCEARGPVGVSSDKQTAIDVACDAWNERVEHAEDLALRTAFRMEG